jgi:Kef-type K+ transport system membrane component KefB/mannitol/fructose-specific phosphotransferase system IIA component (Ntr-type)
MSILAAASFDHGDMITFFLSLAILIGTARILGEIAIKFKQPSILGELMAGIILGPSIFGMIAPEFKEALFPRTGPVYIGLQFMSSLAIALFLLLAGMEIDLRSVFKQGKKALAVSFGGMLIPFALGAIVAISAPALIGQTSVENKTAFVLFFATALSISALPVIARILMDLKLIKSHMGVTILTAAIVNDLLGWLIFAMVLGMIGASGNTHSIGFTLTATILFAGFMFTAGTKIIEKIYPWIQANLSWPAGALNFIIVGGLLCAAFTEWIGIHAIFGTFIFGVAVGQCPHIREKTLHTLESFISFIITPIFFASIGLEVNFFTSFDFGVVTVVLIIGTIGKVGGSWLGGRIAGMSNKESSAIGWAMNARGVMEIILGLIAFQAGLISETLFVALVVLALLTSMTSGALVQRILKRRTPAQLVDLLKKDQIILNLNSTERDEVIEELVSKAADKLSINKEEMSRLVHERESLDGTGLENGVAIPHCRIPGLKGPKVILGLNQAGADFHSMDQSLSKAVFLIITSDDDPQSQLELISQIATLFVNPEVTQKFINCKTASELVAFIKSHDH